MSRKLVLFITLTNVSLVAFLLYWVLGSSALNPEPTTFSTTPSGQEEELPVDVAQLWRQYRETDNRAEALPFLSQIEQMSAEQLGEAWLWWELLSQKSGHTAWSEQKAFLQMITKVVPVDFDELSWLREIVLDSSLSLSLREYAMRLLVDLSMAELKQTPDLADVAMQERLGSLWAPLFAALFPEDNHLASFAVLAFSHLLQVQGERTDPWLDAEGLTLMLAQLLESSSLHDAEITNALNVIRTHQLTVFTAWVQSLVKGDVAYAIQMDALRTLQRLQQELRPSVAFSAEEERLYWSD